MTRTTPARAKSLAQLLRSDLRAAGLDVSHALALELVAHQHGARDWNTLAARPDPRSSDAADTPAAPFGPGVPVLRVVSADTASRFYRDYLGFDVDWQHRFEPGLPLYVQVSRGRTVLHLSEHHGDGSPHGAVWVPVGDVDALAAELHDRAWAPVRPGVDRDAPGGPTLEVIDPDGNVLRFCQATGG
jgi:catechol 2,3-dioxygenase-like lactoylglutathione lyase family enzyme